MERYEKVKEAVYEKVNGLLGFKFESSVAGD